MVLSKESLHQISGGGTFSAAALNAIARYITMGVKVGQYIGSALRRILFKNYC
jgi:hypothetical protein